MKKFKDIVFAINLTIILITFSFVAGIFFQKRIGDQSGTTLNTEPQKVQYQEYDYDDLLSSMEDENYRLQELIDLYESTPEKIKYITKTETIIKGGETVIVRIPENKIESYTFQFENGMPVALFTATDKEYLYKVYDLSLTTDILLAEKDAVVIVTGVSSSDPNKAYQLPTKVTLKKAVEKKKIIDPNLYLGFTFDLNKNLDSQVYASVGLPFIHPTSSLDLATPRVSFNRDSTKIGLDIASWNLAEELPVLNDIWVGPGVSKNLTDSTTTIDLTLGSRF
jgi:hypothetical protein